MSRTFLMNVIAIGIFSIGVCTFFLYQDAQSLLYTSVEKDTTNVAAVAAGTTETTPASSTATKTSTITPPTAQATTKKASIGSTKSTSVSQPSEVARIQNPYTSAPQSFDTVNAQARGALVNILCMPRSGGSLSPISGSGVIIDPRGIILTNAHVAQYILLSESPEVDLSCVIRTGSPANPIWTASVLYIPTVWVTMHASEILTQHPTGTGEHDYALLYISGSVNSTPLPSNFPYLPIDTRQSIAFPGDQVLVAAYPAEFIGGLAAENNLYAISSVTSVKQFYTFSTDTPDLLSLGGVIEAQSGSSGGAVVNAWGHLVGIITTTSDATTTAGRDLRAVSLYYVNTDLTAQTGKNLVSTLEEDPAVLSKKFTDTTALNLIQQYIDLIKKRQQ